MKVVDTLKKYIKKMDGNLIGIGIKDKTLLEEINKNNKIKICDLLNSVSLDSKTTDKKRTKKKYVKNLVKRYKKMKIDYMIIHEEEIEKLLKTFVRDSIKICKKEIHIYSSKKYVLEKIEKRYKRYTKKIEIEKCDNGFILSINVENTKNSFIKDNIYYIIDTLSNISDLVADLLIS